MERLREQLGDWARWLAASFGLPGLFAVAFLDSSVVSLPEVNDVLVVTLSMQQPERYAAFATAAALGSLAGCLLLFGVGRRAGRAALRRLDEKKVARLEDLFRRLDIFAVLVPSLLPPPCPFKIFVLAAGAFGMRIERFVFAVFIGRFTRYLSEGWLAVRYGDKVLGYLEPYALELAALVALGLLCIGLWRHRQRQRRAGTALRDSAPQR